MKPAKIPVGVLAATGSVGQRFVQLLTDHPWFEVAAVTGSERSTGELYGDVCRWILPQAIPTQVASLPVLPTLPVGMDVPLVFSALPASVALEAEPEYARKGMLVCSNASAFRQAGDVPLLLPEVNPEHTGLLEFQRQNRSWEGGITTNPNCTSTGITIALKALQEAFGIQRVFAVSMQALSGAGYPGVPSMDIIDNVIPYVEGEEPKVEWEPRKMLGQFTGETVRLAEFGLSVHCNRVAVSDGHMVCISVGLENEASEQQVIEALQDYQAPASSRELPSAPHPVIRYRAEANRPQPRLDRLEGAGMTTVVGRVRPDSLFDWKMVVLSHNTIRGAAGGSIYNAELLHSQGYI
jgi:aspartate-semialdehyde dehydrogenase